MNEELKKCVQAYLDGEDVEYTYAGTDEWALVTLLEDFDLQYYYGNDKTFRIKPKEEEEAVTWTQLVNHVRHLDDTVTRLTLEVYRLKEKEDA